MQKRRAELPAMMPKPAAVETINLAVPSITQP